MLFAIRIPLFVSYIRDTHFAHFVSHLYVIHLLAMGVTETIDSNDVPILIQHIHSLHFIAILLNRHLYSHPLLMLLVLQFSCFYSVSNRFLPVHSNDLVHVLNGFVYNLLHKEKFQVTVFLIIVMNNPQALVGKHYRKGGDKIEYEQFLFCTH